MKEMSQLSRLSRIANATVMVTGANRGLGRALVPAFLDHGARMVFATMRDPGSSPFDDPRIQALALDVTSDESVEELSNSLRATDILVNNAAYISNQGLLASDLDAARLEMETNYWGLLRMCRAFVRDSRSETRRSIVNVLSLGALASIPFVGSYCTSKAAAHSLTQGLRADLSAEDIEVLAAYPGPIATEMARPGDTTFRHSVDVVAQGIITGIEAGEHSIFPDRSSAELGRVYAGSPATLEAYLSGAVTDAPHTLSPVSLT